MSDATADSLRRRLAAAAQRLPGDSPRLDAELLLAHALGKPRAWLYAHAEDAPDAAAAAAFDALVARRAAGEPLAYLVGTRDFWSLALHVTPATLIPRPETELLVELALQRIAPEAAARIADLGTGSGAVALAIARERPRACVLATDASGAALEVARANALRLGLANVEFAQGDWCAALGAARFDLIVSNPPYLADADPHLQQGDLRHEPATALVSGSDGLDAIRVLARDALAHLGIGAWLLLEHGHDQGEAVRALLRQVGYAQVFTTADLEGRERVSGGRRA